MRCCAALCGAMPCYVLEAARAERDALLARLRIGVHARVEAPRRSMAWHGTAYHGMA